jgi:hypothetical protein
MVLAALTLAQLLLVWRSAFTSTFSRARGGKLVSPEPAGDRAAQNQLTFKTPHYRTVFKSLSIKADRN